MEDYKWFVQMYSHIKTRLKSLIIDKNTCIQFEKDFDISKLEKIINKGIFNLVFTYKIIDNIFQWILKLQLTNKNIKLIEDIRHNIIIEDDIIFSFQEINKIIDIMDKDVEQEISALVDELMTDVIKRKF